MISWAQFLHWFDHKDHHASRHSCTLQPKSTSIKSRVRLGYRSWGPKELTGYNLKENYQLGRYVDSPCRFHSRFSSSALAFGISFPFFPLFSAYFVFTSLGVAYIIVCRRNDRHCSPLCPSLFLLSLHTYSLRCIFGPQLIASFHPIACIIMKIIGIFAFRPIVALSGKQPASTGTTCLPLSWLESWGYFFFLPLFYVLYSFFISNMF